MLTENRGHGVTRPIQILDGSYAASPNAKGRQKMRDLRKMLEPQRMPGHLIMLVLQRMLEPQRMPGRLTMLMAL